MDIRLQLCGIFILLIILLFHHGHKKLGLRTELAFSKCFVWAFVSLILDVSSIAAIVYSRWIPMFLVKLLCKCYLFSLVVFVYLSLVYVYTDIFPNLEQFNIKIRNYRIFTTLSGFVVLLAPIRIFEGSDMEEAYTYGMSVYIAYFCTIVLMISIMYCLVKEKKHINAERRKAVWFWLSLWIGAATIQLAFGSAMKVIGFASAIGIMIVYLMLENPMANIDRTTGLFNQNVMLYYVKQLYREKQNFSVLSISFEHIPGNNVISQSDDRMRKEIIQFLLNIKETIAFKNLEDEIVLIFKNPESSKEITDLIMERFEKGFGSEELEEMVIFKKNVRIPHCHYIYVPNADVVNQVGDLFYLIRYSKENSADLNPGSLLYVTEKTVEKMFCEKEIENMIFNAMEEDRVEVYYQPIYSTKEQKFTSAEALCRIMDENGNLVPPGAFIPIAEKNGMILRLGEIVFDKVCRFIKENDIEQYGIRYIEVNLSVVQCACENLAEKYIEIMEKYQVNPKFINLEITESASLSAKMTLKENMKKLMNYGVIFSLDDFGTGQSNLNYIVDMPVDIVKFDKDMIRAYFENQKAKYVMDAAMHMIQGMQLEIVSEGIETEKQFETMKDLHIAYIQGFYFSKPLPEEEYLNFMARA